MNLKQASREIETIVVAFYRQAIDDVIIGYHFHHIDDFSQHIPRIIDFWQTQLLGIPPRERLPFQLVNKHKPLKIKKGEVGRWVLLFKKTLDEHPLREISREGWKKKVDAFQKAFLKHPHLLHH